MTRLELYGHGYCSLCEEMLAGLAPLAEQLDFAVTWVDIHDAPELEARYGEEVPVLCAGSLEICRHRLDEAALRRYLSTLP